MRYALKMENLEKLLTTGLVILLPVVQTPPANSAGNHAQQDTPRSTNAQGKWDNDGISMWVGCSGGAWTTRSYPGLVFSLQLHNIGTKAEKLEPRCHMISEKQVVVADVWDPQT